MEGDLLLWQSALRNSPLPGHDSPISMADVYQALKHGQLLPILDAWTGEHGSSDASVQR